MDSIFNRFTLCSLVIGSIVSLLLMAGCSLSPPNSSTVPNRTIESPVSSTFSPTETSIMATPTSNLAPPIVETGSENQLTSPTSQSLILQVGGHGHFGTIQEALDTAQPGTIIQVAQGEYKENIVIDTSKNISIQGGWNASFTERSNDKSLTIIDGNGENSVFYIHDTDSIDTNITIDGFTIQNGMSNPGSGILAESNIKNTHLNLVLNNLNITQNNSTYYGGGLSFRTYGGTIKASLTNSIISNNNSNVAGGGLDITCRNSGKADIKLIGNIISNNLVPFKDGGDGGGLIIDSRSNSVTNMLIERCIIYNNRATFGGGICVGCFDEASVNMVLSNNVIHNNKVAWGGGGIFSAAGDTIPGGTINWTLNNNTITSNFADNSSGIVFGTAKGGSTSVTSYNDIVWGNMGGVSEVTINSLDGNVRSIMFTASYCDIHSFWSFPKAIVNSNNVINKDPLFKDRANGDFRLQNNSPCIDAGDPDSSFNDSKRPPALGEECNDLGAYGGPGNFGWPLDE